MTTSPVRTLVLFALSSMLFATLSVVSLPASAQSTEEDKELAGELYDRASGAYSKGEYETAIQFLEQAYHLDPDPVILYNLGRSYEGFGQLDKAKEALLLVQQNANTPQDVQERITTDLKRLANLQAGRTKLGDLAVNTDPAGARIYIDGQVEGTTPFAGKLEVGAHTILVQIDGYQSLERSIEVRKDETTILDLLLPSLAGESADGGPSTLAIASYATLGVGALGVSVGVIMAVMANGELDEFEKLNDGTHEDAAKEHQDAGTSYSTTSVISYSIGFVALATGAGLLLWDIYGTGSDAEDDVLESTAWLPDAISVDPIGNAVVMGWRW